MFKINYVIRIFLFKGNAGGYLGLFLGYAVLNVPELLQAVFNWMYENWNYRKRAATVTPRAPRASRIPILIK